MPGIDHKAGKETGKIFILSFQYPVKAALYATLIDNLFKKSIFGEMMILISNRNNYCINPFSLTEEVCNAFTATQLCSGLIL